MLTDLHIRNFAIIDRLEVAFSPGFNVLTGETGAGKSIIIDAVALLLGDRARIDLVRTGEEEAVVEAVFSLDLRPELRRELEEEGFGDGEELLIRRVVNRNGRNKIFINGCLAKLAQLQPLTSRLMNIYGQHEHQNLQRSETHLAFLDHYAGLESLLEEYSRLYREIEEISASLEKMRQVEGRRRQRIELLEFQITEIDEAGVRAGEDEELLAECNLLQNAERLSMTALRGYEELYGAERAIGERLDAVAGELEGAAVHDAQLTPLAESVRSALYSVEDVAEQLRKYAGKISFDPSRLREVDQRLALLADLKRKYGGGLEAVLDYRTTIGREAEELVHADVNREDLKQRLEAGREKLQALAETLSARRIEAAGKLRQDVELQLQDLAMPKARFEMRLFSLAHPGPSGLERGEFYLAPNPGEDPRPLAWIASGGELSRIMLALRRAAPEGDRVGTLIFDEVDAGIGGVAASAVGEKLRAIARGVQVLCVTHLPQVAAFADQHFRVEKREEQGRTLTNLVPLGGEQRVLEMARMLGGAQVGDATVEHAREMIATSTARP
ncbi:MAG: DNA repair protein RecN [Syntrophotaleaceae bacterium]